MKIPVYDLNGKETEKIDLPSIFETKVNPALLAQAVRVYLANQREGNSSTKTRGEVQGSSRKIYRQKGTGRARHGSIRANIFRHGGIVFGPTPRDFRLEFPQKMRKQALYSALASRLQENSILVLDGLENLKPKTKELIKVFTSLKLIPEKDKIMLILNDNTKNILQAGKNIFHTDIYQARLLNTYEVMNHQKLIFTKQAILSLGNKQEATPISLQSSQSFQSSKTIKKGKPIKKTKPKKLIK